MEGKKNLFIFYEFCSATGGKNPKRREDTCRRRRRRQLSPKGRVIDWLFSWLVSPLLSLSSCVRAAEKGVSPLHLLNPIRLSHIHNASSPPPLHHHRTDCGGCSERETARVKSMKGNALWWTRIALRSSEMKGGGSLIECVYGTTQSTGRKSKTITTRNATKREKIQPLRRCLVAVQRCCCVRK